MSEARDQRNAPIYNNQREKISAKPPPTHIMSDPNLLAETEWRPPSPNLVTDPEPNANIEGEEEDEGPVEDLLEMIEIPKGLIISDPDEQLSQSQILREIVGNTMENAARIDDFNQRPVQDVRLKELKNLAEKEKDTAIKLLNHRNRIVIDEEFLLPIGEGKLALETETTMLDYLLMVGNGIGLSAMLPKRTTVVEFSFDVDLRRPRRAFGGKHGMVGFDTKGRMLYVGKCRSESVFIAMAPKTFARRRDQRCAAGYSSGASQMPRRHYRQVVLMLLHFLANIKDRSYVNFGDDSELFAVDLDCEAINWKCVSTAM